MELNHAYEELKTKSAEVNQRNFEVLLQKEKLEELNELKDKIFMIISRDFRIPLHSLKGLAFLLNDADAIGPDQFKMLLKGLRHNLDKTCDLLENVQWWSKSQMKNFSTNDQRVSLYDLVLESNDLLISAAKEKRITIVNHVDEDAFVRADEEMVRLVLHNLVSNAINFSDSAGRVTLRSSRDDRSINLSVTDSGIGMDLDQQSEVFTHAFRENTMLDDSGAGLGLMICKELMEKNNGRIWMESEPGKGSTFTFSLPAIESRAAFSVNALPKSSL
jgi:signal transduction histidine kinase